MKQFRKYAALLMVVMLAGSLLVSCRQQADPSKEQADSSTAPVQTQQQTENVTPESTKEQGTEETPSVPAGEVIDYAGELKLDMDTPTKKQETSVKMYVDGDTTHFNVPEEIIDTGVLKARYLGINTPESTGNIEKWGKQASNFTKEKLSNAESIIVESDDENWNFDNTTSHRCLCWVWYRPAGSADYRNLNLELLQEGFAIANNSANNRYGEWCMKAIDQAKQQLLHVYSSETDPLYYEGEVRQVTIKALRTDPETYLNTKVSFDAVILREYNNTLYVEAFDEEDGIYYGMNVYYGFSADPDCLAFMQNGNRVQFVGSLQYYEAGGTYQISGIQYKPRKPEESCKLLEENVPTEYVLTDPNEFIKGKKSVIVEVTRGDETMEVEQEYPYAELVMSTALEMKDLHVESIYTTTNDASSSKGAMTLTCKAPDGTYVDIRTVVLYDENGNLVTADAYNNKTIDVQGIVDYYEGGYQIKVFSTGDITVK